MGTPPTVVAGRYRLLRQLGAGGMGQVWLARDEILHRHIAIKQVVLPPGLSHDEAAEARQRTMREARTAARLNHPSVVKIYDVVATDDQPWIVMEYIPARSLQEIINEDGPLEPATAARIGLAVLDALTTAHQHGILHRDVKPGNVLLGADGRVVLTDFGLATFDTGESALTQPGLVFGSVRFVAPERARDGTSSPEADLWALGATLYAAVEGRSPYARQSAMETLTALATALPDPTHRAGPLKPVLRGLLRRDPRYRIGAAEARRLLLRAGGEPVPRLRDRLVPRQLNRRADDRAGTVAPLVTREPAKAPTTVITSSAGPAANLSSGASAAFAAPRSEIPRAASAAFAAPGSNTGGPPASGRPPGHRPWLVVLAAGGAAVLAGAVSLAVAIAARDTRHAAPAPPPSASARAPAVVDPFLGGSICPTTTQVPLVAASRQPGWPALVAGWLWYQDPSGYRIAVPESWQAYRGPGGMCFRDADDRRWLGVSTWTGVDPAQHLAQRRQELVTGSGPVGYQQIGVDTVPYYDGAADWEFRFTNRAGTGMHGVVRDFMVGPGRGYTITWGTTEFDWTTNLANYRLVISSFALPT